MPGGARGTGQGPCDGAGIIRGDEQVTFPALPRDHHPASGHALPDLPPHRRAQAREPQRGPDRALPPGPSRRPLRPWGSRVSMNPAGNEAGEAVVIAFRDAAEFEAWLDAHAGLRAGVWLKIAKKGSGIPSLTAGEAVDAGLCYGWISGQRKSYDEACYLQKYVPRRPHSRWSQVNVAKVEELIAAGRFARPRVRARGWHRAGGRGQRVRLAAAAPAPVPAEPAGAARRDRAHPGRQAHASHRPDLRPGRDGRGPTHRGAGPRARQDRRHRGLRSAGARAASPRPGRGQTERPHPEDPRRRDRLGAPTARRSPIAKPGGRLHDPQSRLYLQPGIFDLGEFFLEFGGIALAVPRARRPRARRSPAWRRTGLLILPASSVSVGGHQVTKWMWRSSQAVADSPRSLRPSLHPPCRLFAFAPSWPLADPAAQNSRLWRPGPATAHQRCPGARPLREVDERIRWTLYELMTWC